MFGGAHIVHPVVAASSVLAACGSDSPDATAPRAVTTGSDDPLERLRTEASQWASWCGPRRFVFPFFQALAEKYEGRVAFLGLNSRDGRGTAADVTEEFPVPFPHFYDEDATIVRLIGGGRAWLTNASTKLDETLREQALNV